VYGNDVMVSGCWFHYAQAVMKQLKKIGLSDAYNNEETTQVVFRCLLALPLLPVADIDPAFKDVKALVQDYSPSKTLLVQLCRVSLFVCLFVRGITRKRMIPKCSNLVYGICHSLLARW